MTPGLAATPEALLVPIDPRATRRPRRFWGPRESTTYGYLLGQALRIAAAIDGRLPGAALLGALAAGQPAYVPLDPSFPGRPQLADPGPVRRRWAASASPIWRGSGSLPPIWPADGQLKSRGHQVGSRLRWRQPCVPCRG